MTDLERLFQSQVLSKPVDTTDKKIPEDVAKGVIGVLNKARKVGGFYGIFIK